MTAHITTTLLSLPDELIGVILRFLSARELLSAAIVCSALQALVCDIVAVGELELADDDCVSDRQLLWLSRSYNGRLRLLDVSGCAKLSKVVADVVGTCLGGLWGYLGRFSFTCLR